MLGVGRSRRGLDGMNTSRSGKHTRPVMQQVQLDGGVDPHFQSRCTCILVNLSSLKFDGNVTQENTQHQAGAS
jgi:hypothetical protein